MENSNSSASTSSFPSSESSAAVRGYMARPQQSPCKYSSTLRRCDGIPVRWEPPILLCPVYPHARLAAFQPAWILHGECSLTCIFLWQKGHGLPLSTVHCWPVFQWFHLQPVANIYWMMGHTSWDPPPPPHRQARWLHPSHIAYGAVPRLVGRCPKPASDLRLGVFMYLYTNLTISLW